MEEIEENKYGKKCFCYKLWLFFVAIIEGLMLHDIFYQYEGEGWFRCDPSDEQAILDDDIYIIDAIKANGLNEIMASSPDSAGIGHIIVCNKCVTAMARSEEISL